MGYGFSIKSGGFNFEKLNVYHEAVNLSVKIYKITSQFPKNEIFGLVSQLRRAGVSVVSNICEGSNRGIVEFKRYLDISRGSIFEIVGQLRISFELELIGKNDHDLLYDHSMKLSKMLMALKKSLK